MEIVSTNLATPKTIVWQGVKHQTGIYKNPTKDPVFLGQTGVNKDSVCDTRVHGGEFKACYIFSEDHYHYWKNLYPNLDWQYGMFGENLTVKGLDESKLVIGDIYKVGNALVQISQSREPCFKVAVKFESEAIIKQFIDYKSPGTYLRVLEEGTVQIGDTFQLIEKAENSLTTLDFYRQLFAKEKNQELIRRIINNPALPEKKQNQFKKFLL